MHYNVRFTKSIFVEAENKDEAFEKAKTELDYSNNFTSAYNQILISECKNADAEEDDMK